MLAQATFNDLKKSIQEQGWNYYGACDCADPMHEWRKKKFIIKLSKAKDLFNIFNPQRKRIAAGTSETLIQTLQTIETN